MTDAQFSAVADSFFSEAHICNLLGSSTGFSGSDFARVETGNGAWCLRRWPVGYDFERLRFIHQVLSHCVAHGFNGVPRLAADRDGKTIVRKENRLYDAQEWIAGELLIKSPSASVPVPNPVCRLRPNELTSLAAGLAEFNLSTDDFEPALQFRTPSLAARLENTRRKFALRQDSLRAWAMSEPESEAGKIAYDWLELLPTALVTVKHVPAIAIAVAEASRVVVHGDFWASHIFFSDASFRGLIDFESLACDTPAVDLAQLILHFNGWDERDSALSAYSSCRPLTTSDNALIPVAALLDLAGEALWSLGSLADFHDSPSNRDLHLANLTALFSSFRSLMSQQFQLS